MASQAASNDFPLHQVVETELSRERKLLLHAAIFLGAFVLVFLRRPDALLNAQFYAEDGTFFYADAYHFGWHSLLLPYGGYLHTPLRLVGLLATLVPFGLAPLVMNLCAIVVQILPIHIFLSSRFNSMAFTTRLVGAFLYLALPNAFEIHANTVNIQSHLALVACLVLLAKPDESLAWRIFDFLALTLFTLGSLMGVLLLPVAALLRWFRKDPRYTFALAAMIPGSILQMTILLFTDSRRPAPNGACLARLINIVGGQVYFSSILGVRTAIQLYFHSHLHSLFFIDSIALAIGLPFILYALRYAPTGLKLFHLFAGLVLAAALTHPIVNFAGNQQQWELLQVPGVGNRYYFFPMLAFLATLVWMAMDSNSKSKLPRVCAMAILVLLPVGIYRDWQYRPFHNLHFQKYAADFEHASPGTQFTIPINPDWTMQLTKR
jgi:hypothetical protein